MSPWPTGLRLVELARAAGLDADSAPDSDEGIAPGTAPEYRFDAERTVAAFGDHLARLHRVGVGDTGPAFEPAVLVDAARRRLAAGELVADELAPTYRHMAPDRLVQILGDGLDEVVERARAERPVLSHGRPVLGSFRFRRGEPLGFTDWAAVTVADRHLDLAVAASDVAGVFGAVVVPVLFDAYGDPPPDPQRIDWFALADALVGP